VKDVILVKDLYLHVNLKQNWPIRWLDEKKDFVSIGFIHRVSITDNVLKISHGACSQEFIGPKIYGLLIAQFLNEFVQYYNTDNSIKITEVLISKTFHIVTPAIKKIQQYSIFKFANSYYGSASTQTLDNKWYVKFNWKLIHQSRLKVLQDQFEASKFDKQYLIGN
jgi:hypothetical protein